MLGMENRLLFPFLRYIKEDQLVHPNGDHLNSVNGRPVTIYKLDWDALDLKKLEKFKDWADRCNHKPEDFPFHVTLPEPYESEVKGYLFALSGGYHSEIQRNAQRALVEWSASRPFDTMIREACLGPAIEHVRTAFYLLADCIWDPETKYWRRDRLLPLSTSLMAYKFWLRQTGGGMVFYHAGLDRLSRQFREENTDKHSNLYSTYVRDESVQKVQAALKAINKLEARRSEQHAKAFCITKAIGEKITRDEQAMIDGLKSQGEPVLEATGDGRDPELGQVD